MKLKVFNAENTRVTRAGVPAIGVNQKTGLFNMNKLAKEHMSLKDGDNIVIHQDEDAPENWYMEKVKTNGFVIREGKNDTGGLLFSNTALARAIAEGGGFPGAIAY